jgi:uncharacterized metal-binding protein
LKKRILEADEVVILDGCQVQCAASIATAQGVRFAQRIVVTDLGIKKASSQGFSDTDVEIVVSAVWEGAGRNDRKGG